MRVFVIPDGVVVPPKARVFAKGRWTHIPALARCRTMKNGMYAFKQALLVVDEPVDLERGVFVQDDGSVETYEQFVVGSSYILRLGVYGRTRSYQWLPPEEALQELGLQFEPLHRMKDGDATGEDIRKQTGPVPTTAQASQQHPVLKHSAAVAAAPNKVVQPSAGAGSSRRYAQLGAAAAAVPAAAVAASSQPSVLLSVPYDGLDAVYSPVRQLGSGGMALAWLLQRQQPHPTLPSQIVLKLLRKGRPAGSLNHEAINMHKLAQHPNVVRFYTVWGGDASWCPGASGLGFGILMEYCANGSSLSYLDQQLQKFQAALAARTVGGSSCSSSGASQVAAVSASSAQQGDSDKPTLAQTLDQYMLYKADIADLEQLSSASDSGRAAAAAAVQTQQQHSVNVQQAMEYLAAAAAAPRRIHALEVPVRTYMYLLLGYMCSLHHNAGATQRPALGVHHDFKPDNIFIGSDGIPKLGDWGMARIMSLTHTTECRPFPGATPLYTAPEKLVGSRNNASGRRASPFFKSDIWSAVLTWLELLTGLPPFFWMADAHSELVVLFRQQGAQVQLEQLLDTYYSPLLPPATLAFFKWALQVDEDQRPSMADLHQHPYVSDLVLG